jgi:hypothetical protein
MSDHVLDGVVIPDDDWRDLTEYERAILDRLLEREFAGRSELRAQLTGCKVMRICGLGTLKFKIESGNAASVTSRVPVEAIASDADGNPIYYLLHVVNGFVAELEIYTATTLDMKRVPHPDELRIMNTGEHLSK